MAKRWCTVGELETIVTRERVLELNEYLDAIEEAEEEAHREARAKRK